MTTATENEFRVARVDAGPGGALAQAMREEIAEMYDGLDLDGPSMPKAGAEELGRREASSSSGGETARPSAAAGSSA